MNTGQIFSLTWNMLVAIVGLTSVLSAALSALVVWLVVRFTKSLDSYTEEFAKQVARHQNLDKLVEETRRLTDTAEKIRAEFSHENWDRQTRWTKRLEVYGDTAQKLDQYIHRLRKVRITPRTASGVLQESIEDLTVAVNDIHLALYAATLVC